MIVTCERCSARYKLDDNKIKGRGARITCPKCQHVFVVYNKAQGEPPPAADPDPEGPSADEPSEPRSDNPLAQDPDNPTGLVGTSRQSDQLDFRKVGISTWKVKVKIGLVYDFSDISTLRKYIQDRRVTEDDVISHDGSNWVRIGDIPDLDAYFLQVYEELEDRLAGGADNEADTGEPFEDDGPTMVVGMGSLRSNISTGVFQRPGAKAEGAPPSARPLPGKPSGGRGAGAATDSNRFVDPFESLKARQRDRMRAKRRGDSDGTSGSGSKGKNAKGGGRGRSNLWLGLAALMGVLLVGWYFFLRVPPQAVQPEPTGPTVVQPPTQDADDFQKHLIAQLEAEMRKAGATPDLDAPVVEPVDPYITITPARRREMCSKGELPASSCAGVGAASPTTGPGPQSDLRPVGTTTTAADHANAARTAAQQRNWSTAIAGYSNAVKMEPGNGSYRLGLAEAYFRGGQLERAQGEFHTLKAAGEKRALKFLGLIADQIGDPADANSFLREYDAAYPGDSEVQQKLQELTGG